MTLNVKNFLSISVRLAFEASRIIDQVYRSSFMNPVWKGHDDPVTEADYRIQKMISSNLRDLWPALTIVGEEQLVGDIQYRKLPTHKISKEVFPHDCLENVEEEMDVEHACVWIDPLDGTLSYTQGHLHEVTTLIGLSYKREARLGIIGLPYTNNAPGTYHPRVVFGSSHHPLVYEMDMEKKIKKYTQRELSSCFTITTSRVDNDSQCKQLARLGNKVIRSSGAGKKFYQVLSGEADAMVYFGNRCSKWDTCAGEALIKAIGGETTGLAGQPLNYDPNDHHYYNEDSVVTTLTGESRSRITSLIHLSSVL